MIDMFVRIPLSDVLNLVISGIPSILKSLGVVGGVAQGFKPCYKWNTFNTSSGSFLSIIRSTVF